MRSGPRCGRVEAGVSETEGAVTWSCDTERPEPPLPIPLPFGAREETAAHAVAHCIVEIGGSLLVSPRCSLRFFGLRNKSLKSRLRRRTPSPRRGEGGGEGSGLSICRSYPSRHRGARRLGQREAIADAEFGHQDARLGRVGLDLLAQLAHEDAQVVRVVDVRRAPHFLEQDTGGSPRCRRAGRGSAAAGIPSGSGSRARRRWSRSGRRDRSRAVRPAPPARPRSPALAGACAACARAKQLRHAERLDHVVVGAAFQQAHLLGLVRAHRQHDQRDARPGAQPLEHVGAVHVGQAEIEDDEIRRRERHRPHGFRAGLRLLHRRSRPAPARRAGSGGSGSRRRRRGRRARVQSSGSVSCWGVLGASGSLIAIVVP